MVNKATTVSVNPSDRDFINEEAERLGLSQRQTIVRMVEIYKTHTFQAGGDVNLTEGDLARKIFEDLEKVVKRDDRIVAFIKEQEKVILNPTLRTVQIIDSNLAQLVELLSNLT